MPIRSLILLLSRITSTAPLKSSTDISSKYIYIILRKVMCFSQLKMKAPKHPLVAGLEQFERSYDRITMAVA